MLLLLLSAVVVPLEAGYDLSGGPGVATMLALMDACFILNVAIRFRTAHIVEHLAFGALVVKNPRQIAKAYVLGGHFFLDMLGAVPVELIIASSPTLSNNSWLKLIKRFIWSVFTVCLVFSSTTCAGTY